MLENFIFELICFRFIYQTRFVITFIRTLMMKSICELYVICGMYVESCTILVVVNRLSRPVVVLDGLPGLYGFKYDSVTAFGLPLYLYSYKLVGSATKSLTPCRWWSRWRPARSRPVSEVSQLGWANLRRVPFTPGLPKPSPLPALIMIGRST